MALIKRLGWSGALLFLIFVGSVFLFFNSHLRQVGRQLFAPPQREILSVAYGRAVPDKDVRVVKIQTPEGLFIEVYGAAENGFEPLIDRLKLPDRRDAYFQFKGRASNLALQDQDGDHVYEIIAPTYDESLVPHVNMYKYNANSGHFEVYERE